MWQSRKARPLAIETLEKRSALFERAAAFRGLARERMLAVGVAGELFVRLFPEHSQVEQIIRAASIWEKTSEKRRMVMRSCEARCIGIVAGIVRDGIAQTDLTLPANSSPEDLVFGLWSLTYGAYRIVTTSDSLVELGIRNPFESIRENQMLLLDGYAWKPLSCDHDYVAVTQRIEKELFAAS